MKDGLEAYRFLPFIFKLIETCQGYLFTHGPLLIKLVVDESHLRLIRYRFESAIKRLGSNHVCNWTSFVYIRIVASSGIVFTK